MAATKKIHRSKHRRVKRRVIDGTPCVWDDGEDGYVDPGDHGGPGDAGPAHVCRWDRRHRRWKWIPSHALRQQIRARREWLRQQRRRRRQRKRLQRMAWRMAFVAVLVALVILVAARIWG